MADAREPQLAADAAEIAHKILFAKEEDAPLGRTIFLIGAGCSISAGIPGAEEIARRMVCATARRLRLCGAEADAVAAYAALVQGGALEHHRKDDPTTAPRDAVIDWYAVYDAMFRRHYTAPDDVRGLFGGLVEAAQGAVNWAHLCLGEMVAQKLVSTVLTTNFDQLVLSGMVRAGILPVLCDGVESLNRLDETPRHPQLVELHGSRHTYLLRNAAEDVAAVSGIREAISAVQKLFHSATTFVAVGYGGREAGVMDLLIRAAESYPDKNLFWVAHSTKPADIGPKVRAFLASSRNARLLLGQDADRFFLDLCVGLKVGSPGALSRPLEPLERLLADVRRSVVTDNDIRREIEDAEATLKRLREQERKAPPDRDTVAASEIRELRLKGDLEGAYAAAEAAIGDRDVGSVPVGLLEEAGRAALAHGERNPERGPLEAAEMWFRGLVDRQDCQTDRGAARNLLGTVLQTLGERESDTARLEEAVAVYRAALEERTRERVPLDWAGTQNNLGLVLWRLGERESETVRLEEAVTAHRAALAERTRERVPLDWAETQNNLGLVLWRLGERESGTARLEQAVVAYRSALEEWTRERVPLSWATTQMNLGNALWALGERESGTARLEEAVAAFRAALEEWTRERVPLDWAATQNNLSNALSSLGEREGSAARLEEAVVACRSALEEWTRERVPLNWAMTQNNLGATLRVLGERESGTGRLVEAVAAFRAALEEYTRERVPLDWATTQNNLAIALRALGARESGTARLEEAVAAYRAALQVVEGAWPAERVQAVRDALAAVEGEIARRGGG